MRSRMRIRLVGGMLVIMTMLLRLHASLAILSTHRNHPTKVEVAGAEREAFFDPDGALAVMDSNLKAIGATDFRKLLDLSGKGQTIAIIDTGVDPLVAGFRDRQGVCRVAGWVDFTGEGEARVLGKYQVNKDILEVAGTKLDVGDLTSRTGTFIVGLLPDTLWSRAQTKRDTYFVVFDPLSPGVFEAVAIDTNGDFSFSREPVLFKYEYSRTTARIPVSGETAISVVVTDIRDGGQLVSFGFDINGHGTALASIAAGDGPVSYRGVAPGAQIIAVKAIRSDGSGKWGDILAAIKYALDKDADVILVGAVPDEVTDNNEWVTLQKLASRKGVHLVVPAGNRGPGVGTLTFLHYSTSLIVAGGYLPRSVQEQILKISAKEDQWYPWSSCGPDASGNSGIDVLAPAMTIVPAQGYHYEPRFVVVEGTSVSAAFTAGSIVLLREAAHVFSAGPNYEKVTKGLLFGATRITGIFPVEQGYGRLNLVRAWETYKIVPRESSLVLARKWNGTVSSDGLSVRGYALGAFPFWVDNLAPFYRTVDVTASVPWLRAQSPRLVLAPVSQRETIVYGTPDLQPGFYSGELVVDDPATELVDERLVVSVTIPNRFSPQSSNATEIELDGRVPGNSIVSRHFIEVPQSVESLLLSFSNGLPNTTFAIFNPDGRLIKTGNVLIDSQVRIGLPKTGIWQICLFLRTAQVKPNSLLAKVNVRLEGTFVIDLGTRGEWQRFHIFSSHAVPVTYRLIAPDKESEYRERRSILIPTDRATVLSLPEVSDEIEGIWLRLGTVSGESLKAYLYFFSNDTGKWMEVARASTSDSGFGSLQYAQPRTGKYLVYVEAYGSQRMAYAEIELLLLVSAGAQTRVPMLGAQSSSQASLEAGFNVVTVFPGQTARASRTIALVRSTDSRILAVFERSVLDEAELPVVQVLGHGYERIPAVKTIRAWNSHTAQPVDTIVIIGTASYQLQRGRLTGMFPQTSQVLVPLSGQAGYLCISVPDHP